MQRTASNDPLPPRVAIMGVSASGKTVVGQALAIQLGAAFVDGDDLHPPTNRAKMAGGTPLEDADRWPWLDRVGAVLADAAGYPNGVVVACSALRRAYRDRIRAAAGPNLVFAFLDIGRDEAARRIASRQGHFMPSSLLDSQFATLERPDGEPDVVAVSAHQSVEATAAGAAAAVRAHGRGKTPG